MAAGFEPPPYPYDRLDEIIAIANEHDGGAVDLSIGTPCDPTPPEVLAALSAGDSARGYPSSIGSLAFRQAAAAWIEGGLNGARFYPQHNRKTPPNALLNPYRTADNRWLLLVAAQEKDWPGFIKAIGLAKLLEDPRFTDKKTRLKNAAALVEILDPLFASQPLRYWKELLDEARVIFGVVQNAEEIINDPQMHLNGIFAPVTDPEIGAQYTVNSPVQVAGVTKVSPGRAPHLGEHSDAVLRELGFSADEVSGLFASGTAVKSPEAH